ncbi:MULTISPECIES: DTW domain-containing protein [unclassified Clostridium]|jgi:DTW domain-containing protein YfiP|uniref:tRNA-uridine aminocarboxypropyltransferase n=1 Tax=Clostridium TaxID=1485 RepID=UPI001C8B896F|nr:MULTISPECIES: DTW domain-containing protein [unclassified Clostridium]MBX9139111.1 DTW domain-containing protein [Clostridium sp. K12(2020)]MBX9145889.1 DTW domain-containing protein [Clostridium sp. K13]MDU2291231.1 DTW domain-containing protein [Clostridium celatum]MDU4325077.1 DTW domain-containing protein [Clostridium celatum]
MKNKKQITRICENCSKCGLPIITCICKSIKEVETKAKFVILSSEKEVYRNTNTANLLKQINTKSTEIIIWKRGEIPSSILSYINNDIYNVYLVFPIMNKEMEIRKAKYNKDNNTPVFIIVDGTWREAWKIIRKSDYLKNLPILSLETNRVSKFTLRRGQEEGNLCTIEAAMELLKINDEDILSEEINKGFELFLKSYKAGASGHKINL